jgi:hypothetical protein
METNVFGTLAMSRTFAPSSPPTGVGRWSSILSALSWLALPSSAVLGVEGSRMPTHSRRMIHHHPLIGMSGRHLGLQQIPVTG